jgi:ATP-dependent Clp protease ATP-binding subunit ClpB
MTSNVGSQYILENMDEDWADVQREVWDALRQQFLPEFLNRVDDIILFRPLGQEEIAQIIDLQLARLRKLLAERKLSLELTPEARQHLAEEGYDRAFGARPLKRAIQRLLQNPLAMAVLEGRFGEGDTVVADLGRDGELTFERAGEPAAAGAR